MPGSPLDPRSEGTNGLIKQGAALITGAADVLDVLRPDPGPAQRVCRRVIQLLLHCPMSSPPRTNDAPSWTCEPFADRTRPTIWCGCRTKLHRRSGSCCSNSNWPGGFNVTAVAQYRSYSVTLARIDTTNRDRKGGRHN